ncbi:2-keto-myo-inositol dehydratase [Halobacillus karajensis]|uniref:sugar phosphate isomerase/epimerase family protein n=1 Tax=Halobacillus karajensis TaxID=195088 RepID=UPI0008A7BF0E|nr:sugar phosphate isomerase/epimerase [Halobacillus karajensis]SEI14070.1 2-keto-myo-inositol dehydratase [Halobacillus karajensis]
MNVGYMTNAFGPLVGSGGGVTSIKDVRYETLCRDVEVFQKIQSQGFNGVEMFDGNLDQFASQPKELKEQLQEMGLSLYGVYAGANFIYEDAWQDELWRIQRTARIAAEAGAKHLVLGGGAVRASGEEPKDISRLAESLAEAESIVGQEGLIASYHPHLGSMIESPEQIDQLFSYSSIAFCPDLAHLAAGGGDPLEIIKKYRDRIPYIHLKDWDGEGFVPLGHGNIDLHGIIDFLEAQSYTGDWLVEIDGYAGDPLEACKVSYEFLKNTSLNKNIK